MAGWGHGGPAMLLMADVDVLGAGAAHSNRTAGAGDEKGTKLPEITQFRIYYSR